MIQEKIDELNRRIEQCGLQMRLLATRLHAEFPWYHGQSGPGWTLQYEIYTVRGVKYHRIRWVSYIFSGKQNKVIYGERCNALPVDFKTTRRRDVVEKFQQYDNAVRQLRDTYKRLMRARKSIAATLNQLPTVPRLSV